jgi:TolB-like protein/DNA-binding winged helix-turn-helix (wHTH) protein
MPATGEPQERICFGEFELDVRTRELQKNGERFDLQEQPFLVLTTLLEQPGQLVTRQELIKRLWAGDTFVDFEHSLNKAVKRLREALHDSAEQPQFIETLPRRGYRFIGTVAAPRPPSRESEEQRATGNPFPLLAGVLRWRFAAISGLALSVAALVIALWIGDRRGHSAETASIRSLAVLPLENLSGDPSQDYLADGMTDELITSLGQISALRVISRTTAMQYKEGHKPLPQIARELSVDVVVEGSLVRSGDRLRIDAQLIDATADKQFWAHSFEGDLHDILGLENQVASAVAEEIRIKVTPTERTQLADTRQMDPRASEAFFKGGAALEINSLESQRIALQFFQQAVQIDPRFARAYVGVAKSYNYLAGWGGFAKGNGIAVGEATGAADSAIAKALELDPGLGEAYEERAWTIMKFRWDFPSAEAGFRRALEIDPSAASAHDGLSEVLLLEGRFDEALREMKLAEELDPLSLVVNTDYCRVLQFTRHDDLAVVQCDATVRLGPNYSYAMFETAQLHERKGDYSEGHRLWCKVGGCDRSFLAMVDEIHGAPGVTGAFDTWLKKQKHPPEAFFLARAYAGLHRKDQAFAWLEKAYELHSDVAAMCFVGVDPDFDQLHSDPRFDAFLHRVGLPPQPKMIADGHAHE